MLEPVARVALVGPFSGPRAAWGELLAEGATIPYAAVRFDRFDDRGEVAEAVARADEIVADGRYAAVLGHFNSLGAAQALPRYRAAGLAVVLPLATAPELAPLLLDSALRLCPDDEAQAAALVEAARTCGPRLLVVHDSTGYGVRLADRVARITGTDASAGWPDDVEADATVLCGVHHSVAALVRDRPAGCGQVLVPDDCDIPEFVDLAGSGALVVRIAGGPLARVAAGATALAAALGKRPESRGAALVDAVRGELAGPVGWRVARTPRHAGSEPYDVAVVGAGVVGRATAAALAESGAQVALLTGDAPGSGASVVSGALVRACELGTAARELSLRAYQLIWGEPELAAAHGFRRTGTVILVRDLHLAPGAVAALRGAGIEAELLPAAEVARRWPDIDVTDLAGAVWEPHSGYVVAGVALAALLDRARRAGVAVLGRRVLGPVTGDGVLRLADGGTLRARRVVVAAGCGAPELLGEHWPAERPARTKRIRYAIFARGGRELPAVVDATTGAWGRPDGSDGYLAGFPVDEWGVSVTAGATLTEPQLTAMRAGVSQRLPFLAKADVLTGRFGTDLFVDGGPVLGAVPGAPGVLAAAGWSGAGFKTAPAAAERIAREF